MNLRHRRVALAMLLAIAGMTVSPARAQEQAVVADAPVADAAPLVETPPVVAELQTQQAAPAPARLSMAEKAAAVAGAVAAGAVAFKGLSALFKSGKKSVAAPAVALPAPID